MTTPLGTAAGAPAWVLVSMDIVRQHLMAYRAARGKEASQALIDAFQRDQLEKLNRHLEAPERVAYRPMTLMEWEDTQWHI